MNDSGHDNHAAEGSGTGDGTARLLHRLDLTEITSDAESTTWRGQAGEHAMNMSGRLFGGMVMAQAVVAAGRTDPTRRVHSLQQCFLRGGQPDLPIDYRCVPLFDGRTYGALRIEAYQDSELISHAQVGLTTGVEGPEHELPANPRSRLEDTGNRDEYRGRKNWQDQPVEMRAVPEHENDGDAHFDTWLRPYGPIPDDDLVLHQAVLAFASDRAFMTTAWKPLQAEHGRPRGATLDHTIWFHRPFRFDDWHVFAMHGPTVIDGRGISQGTIHRVDGPLVATVTQQGSLRVRRPTPDTT